MRQKLKNYLVALAACAVSLLPTATALAAGGSISLTANRSTVPAGGSLIIAIYVNGGGNNVNAVQADVSYPSSKLQYVGFSATGSAFEIGATNGGSDGLATVGRGTVSPVNGSALLGTMTFRALAGSGSASIALAGSSSLVSDGNAVPYGSSGVTVNFGGSAASSSGSTAKTATAAPAPPKDTTAPKVSAVKVSQTTPFSATVTWTTDEASDSAVDYGIDPNYGLSNSTAGQTTAHSVVLNSGFLSPMLLVHYRVKSVDGAGNVATGTDLTFQLPGVPVTVVVRGPDGKPLAGAQVTVDGSTGITNSKGVVTLRSGIGNKKITTLYNGTTIQKPITVARTAKPMPPIQLDLSKKPLNPWMLSTAGLMVLVFVLLALDAVLFGSKILARLTGFTFTRPHLLALPKIRHHAAGAAGMAAPTALPPKESAVASEETGAVHEVTAKAAQDQPALDELAPEAQASSTPAESAPQPEAPRVPPESTAEDMDMTRSIADLMDEAGVPGDPPLTETELPQPEPKALESEVVDSPTKSPMITHIGPAAQAPIAISLEPLSAAAAQSVPTAPPVTAVATEESPSADLAKRLKPKTTHPKKPATSEAMSDVTPQKPAKKITVTEKPATTKTKPAKTKKSPKAAVKKKA